MMPFDIDYIRAQFPAFADTETGQWAFFDNAGGSYAAAAVVDKLMRFVRDTKVQPYGTSAASQAAGEAMDLSQHRLAAAINAEVDEVSFGPSTSINTYVLAQAMRAEFRPGDEVIVSVQEHEANAGCWHRMAEGGSGIVVRQWPVDAVTGLLDIDALSALLTERTRLVCVTHCSNIVGAINDIAEIARRVHRVGARLAVDGVSFAPHLAVDVKALDVDFYYFSLYKTFGLHQGLLYVRRSILEQIPNQGHFFNADNVGKKLTPAGPQHELIGAVSGMVDYLEDAARHHFPDPSAPQHSSVHQRVAALMQLGHQHEVVQANRILSWLRARQVRLIGDPQAEAGQRAPTIAFTTPRWKPAELAAALCADKVGVGAGHFYAYRLLQALGIDPEDGVVRLSLVHYTSAAEVDRLLAALERHL